MADETIRVHIVPVISKKTRKQTEDQFADMASAGMRGGKSSQKAARENKRAVEKRSKYEVDQARRAFREKQRLQQRLHRRRLADIRAEATAQIRESERAAVRQARGRSKLIQLQAMREARLGRRISPVDNLRGLSRRERMFFMNSARRGGGIRSRASGRSVGAVFQVQQAIEDFQFAGLRGAANNMAVLAAQIGGTGGIIALLGVMAVTLGPAIAKLFGLGKASEEATKSQERLRKAILATIGVQQRLRGQAPPSTVAAAEQQIREGQMEARARSEGLRRRRGLIDELNALEKLLDLRNRIRAGRRGVGARFGVAGALGNERDLTRQINAGFDALSRFNVVVKAGERTTAGIKELRKDAAEEIEEEVRAQQKLNAELDEQRRQLDIIRPLLIGKEAIREATGDLLTINKAITSEKQSQIDKNKSLVKQSREQAISSRDQFAATAFGTFRGNVGRFTEMAGRGFARRDSAILGLLGAPPALIQRRAAAIERLFARIARARDLHLLNRRATFLRRQAGAAGAGGDFDRQRGLLGQLQQLQMGFAGETQNPRLAAAAFRGSIATQRLIENSFRRQREAAKSAIEGLQGEIRSVDDLRGRIELLNERAKQFQIDPEGKNVAQLREMRMEATKLAQLLAAIGAEKERTRAQKALSELKKAKFAAGGMVRGRGGRDRVPAMLTRGEVVLNSQQQGRLGAMFGGSPAGVFSSIGVPGFADGGQVLRDRNLGVFGGMQSAGKARMMRVIQSQLATGMIGRRGRGLMRPSGGGGDRLRFLAASMAFQSRLAGVRDPAKRLEAMGAIGFTGRFGAQSQFIRNVGAPASALTPVQKSLGVTGVRPSGANLASAARNRDRLRRFQNLMKLGKTRAEAMRITGLPSAIAASNLPSKLPGHGVRANLAQLAAARAERRQREIAAMKKRGSGFVGDVRIRRGRDRFAGIGEGLAGRAAFFQRRASARVAAMAQARQSAFAGNLLGLRRRMLMNRMQILAAGRPFGFAGGGMVGGTNTTNNLSIANMNVSVGSMGQVTDPNAMRAQILAKRLRQGS